MIRVGVIVDDGGFPELVAQLIHSSASAKHFQITHMFVQELGGGNSNALTRVRNTLQRRGVRRMLRQVLWHLITDLDALALRFSPHFSGAGRRHAPADSGLEVINLRPRRSRSGLVHRFEAKDIERIRESGCDVLVRGCSGILRGEILSACKFGVISLHHGDNDRYRGSPAGFWEVWNREPTTGFVVQQLTEVLDGGNVLKAGHIPTRRLWSLNREQVFRKANTFLIAVLEHIGRTGQLPSALDKKPYAHPLYSVPSVPVQLGYLTRVLFPAVVARVLARLPLRRTTRWGVAFQFVGDWREAVLNRATVIPNPPARFLADPFIWEHDGQHVCFVEDYHYGSCRGRISAYALEPGGARFLGLVLDEPFHLSYPFLFEHEGTLYMCPETSAIGEIRLYKCLSFPLEWEFAATLLRDVSAVDTNIFFHDGRWWMLTNRDSSHIGEHCSELHLYHAESPCSGDWQAHPQNPIMVDAHRARNGGFIADGNAVWRVFQVQGFQAYGESSGVARIRRLSPSSYDEQLVCMVEPAFFPRLVGTHTFTYRNGVVAFDFARREWLRVRRHGSGRTG